MDGAHRADGAECKSWCLSSTRSGRKGRLARGVRLVGGACRASVHVSMVVSVVRVGRRDRLAVCVTQAAQAKKASTRGRVRVAQSGESEAPWQATSTPPE